MQCICDSIKIYFLQLVAICVMSDVLLGASEIYSNFSTTSDTTKVLEDLGNINSWPSHSIFYIETAPRGLNLREACSVESAARIHPRRTVFVFFTEPVHMKYFTTRPMIALSKYKNIKMLRLNPVTFSKGTPLEEILTSKNLKESSFFIYHMADVLRYLVLYKFGGVYSDLDVIVVKSFDLMPQVENWTSREDDEALAAGVMSFSNDEVGRRVINKIIAILKNQFDPNSFCYNSIGVLQDALLDICKVEIEHMSAEKCQGFEVYSKDYFYIIPTELANIYFHSSDISPKVYDLPNVYGFHVWNYLTRRYPLHNNSLYARLMKTYCPNVDKLSKNIYKTTVVLRTKVNYLYKHILINKKRKVNLNNLENLHEKVLGINKKNVESETCKDNNQYVRNHKIDEMTTKLNLKRFTWQRRLRYRRRQPLHSITDK